jgi:hypothetical protein
MLYFPATIPHCYCYILVYAMLVVKWHMVRCYEFYGRCNSARHANVDQKMYPEYSFVSMLTRALLDHMLTQTSDFFTQHFIDKLVLAVMLWTRFRGLLGCNLA